MKKLVFTINDLSAGVCGPLCLAGSKSEISRILTDAVQGGQSLLARYPHDFEVCLLAEFDVERCTLIPFDVVERLSVESLLPPPAPRSLDGSSAVSPDGSVA